jgi:hypothetical protein
MESPAPLPFHRLSLGNPCGDSLFQRGFRYPGSAGLQPEDRNGGDQREYFFHDHGFPFTMMQKNAFFG